MEKTKICSKCKIEKPISEYHKNGFDKAGNQKYRGYCKDCANKRETERYWEKRAYAESQKTQCEKCGDTRVYLLDFHHIDPSSKEFTIGKMKKGIGAIEQEIKKCVCLCANCHREFHYLNKKDKITIDDYLSK